jgi:hypothetical protein
LAPDVLSPEAISSLLEDPGAMLSEGECRRLMSDSRLGSEDWLRYLVADLRKVPVLTDWHRGIVTLVGRQMQLL